MTDFYGIGPRNKRLGYRKSEHICYYCQLDKHQDCEGRKSVTKEIRQRCDCSCYKNENIEGSFDSDDSNAFANNPLAAGFKNMICQKLNRYQC